MKKVFNAPIWVPVLDVYVISWDRVYGHFKEEAILTMNQADGLRLVLEERTRAGIIKKAKVEIKREPLSAKELVALLNDQDLGHEIDLGV